MIKVRRGPVPPFLQSEEVREAQRRLMAHLHLPNPQRLQLRPPIDERILYDYRVTGPLWETFGGRCAYCEQPVSETGATSHHRPLFTADTSDKDYYAWLAYEWRNLLLLCVECNKRSADNFPISGQRGQYLALIEDLRTQESPLLIDPTHEPPTKHFDFLFTGGSLGLTPRGRAIINFLDLNRPSLVEARRAALATIVEGWREAVVRQDDDQLRRFLEPGAFLGARISLVRRALQAVGLPPGPVGLNGRMAQSHLVGQLRFERSDALLETAVERLIPLDNARATPMRDRSDRSRWSGDDMIRGYVEVPRPPHVEHEIASVTIRNLKAIDQLELTFSESRKRRSGAPCLMLLGENAVGKSTALCGIALALIGTTAARRLHLKASHLARSATADGWDQFSADKVEIEVRFYETRESVTFAFDPRNGASSGTREPATLVLGYGARRRFSATASGTGSHALVRSLFNAEAAIPHPGPWLATLSPERFDVVARALRSVLPTVDNEVFTRDVHGNVMVSAHGQRTPLEHLSEGYQSMVILVVDIIKKMLELWPTLEQARGVVLIDEIETHLHPRWKLGVMRALRNAMPRVQFIVTTHDPLCLRGMDNGEVVVLQRDNDRRIFAVEDLPDIEGMRAEQLLTSEYFGLWSTVDEGVELDMARYAARGAPPLPQADALVKRLTLGDTAQEQVINAALQGYLEARERPRGSLSGNARQEAVEAVIRALKGEDTPGSSESGA